VRRPRAQASSQTETHGLRIRHCAVDVVVDVVVDSDGDGDGDGDVIARR
jgi:hypothetical protein